MPARISLNNDMFNACLEANDLTIYKLAERMEVKPSTIYRALKDENTISSDTMAKMMDAFNLDRSKLSELFIFKRPLHKCNDRNEVRT